MPACESLRHFELNISNAGSPDFYVISWEVLSQFFHGETWGGTKVRSSGLQSIIPAISGVLALVLSLDNYSFKSVQRNIVIVRSLGSNKSNPAMCQLC